MQEKLQNVLDGKLKVTDISPEELPEFIKIAQGEFEKTKSEVTGLREAKRAETDRVEKLKAEVDKANKIIADAKEAEDKMKATTGQITQFRQEQIEKAKAKFLSSFKVSDEDKPKVEEIFSKLDSGKVDAELIFNDFVRSYAAVNPDEYIKAKDTLKQMEKNAFNANQSGASGGSTTPPGGDPPKFSEEVLRIAKESNITPEAAQTVMREGMSRKIA